MLDTHELGRRPGSQRRTSLTVPAPSGLGIDVLGVPEDAAVLLELRLEAVMEGVLVTGTAEAEAVGQCSRCLDVLDDPVTVSFQELFVYDDGRSAGETGDGAERTADAEDADVSRLEGDLLDLEPLVRDSVVLALPFQPLCREDCPGLCTVCGARLADDPDHQHDEPVDPRWAKLAELAHEPDERRPDAGPTEE